MYEHTYRTGNGISKPNIELFRPIEVPKVAIPSGKRGAHKRPQTSRIVRQKSLKLAYGEDGLPYRLGRYRVLLKEAVKTFGKTLGAAKEMENCSNVEEMEIAYKSFRETILKSARRRPPGRFKSSWNQSVDKLAKEKTKLYIQGQSSKNWRSF